MAIGTEEALIGGVAPQFAVDVSAVGDRYRGGDGTTKSVDELTTAWRGAATYASSVPAIFAGSWVAAGVALLVDRLLFLAVLIAAMVLLIWTAARATRRRRIVVSYRLDDPAARAFEAMKNGVGWVATSRGLWRITHEEAAIRPANTTSMTRAAAREGRGDANLLTNIDVPSIVGTGQTLLFLPDVLVIRDAGANLVDVPYSSIRAECETVRFSESQTVPPDSRGVGSSWLYANKNGSPDRRRANNREIPVLEYARVTLSWRRSGCVLLVSNVEAASHFTNALQGMAGWRRPVAEPQRVAGIAATPRPVQPAPEVKMPIQQTVRTTELERALQASIDRKKRLDELERRAAAVVARAETSARTQAPATPGTAAWVPEGHGATVHGFATGPFVYVGTRLPGLNGQDVEPALLNPSLPVDPAHANTTGAGMTYWPSYHGISAASRRALLQWLSGGRKDPGAYIGYVFLFFYGLERRVYEFMQGRGSSADEVLAIGREVARLLGIYGETSGSFASYGSSLLDLIASIEPRARGLGHDGTQQQFGPSQRLKITLGELALARKPIPAEHALEWLRSSYSLNTPATRCAREFELLFHIRYAKRFGEGLLLEPSKNFVDLSYRPASAALEPLVLKQGQIPDVTLQTRPLAQMIELAQECSSALDAFSRFLGKNPEGRESLAGFALLPDDLVEGTASSDAASLASLVQSRLDESGLASLAAGELLQFVRLAKPDKVSKSEAMLLAQALEKLGYGIEPDVRLGGPGYDVDGRVVVFRRLPDCPSVASGEYAVATLLVRLSVMVSAADDAVSYAERELLERHIEERLGLSAGERQRLSAHLAWLLDADLGTAGLRRRIESLSHDTRRAIGKLLIDVAATDGHVDAREMKILEKLYDLLDLPSGELYRDVHAAQATDDEPVPVDQPLAPSRGFAIPPKPVAATRASGIDMDRVRLKIDETRQVSTLLSSIFVEEESPAAAVQAAPPAAAPQANTIGTLDAAHSELLRRLAKRESWPRDEVERLAAELALLPDGALETINDYAYATVDEPLWEDDDPVAINPKVAMELTA